MANGYSQIYGNSLIVVFSFWQYGKLMVNNICYNSVSYNFVSRALVS